MQRISVVGTTGSGKTAFARALAERLGVPHIEIDALHWGPNWSERTNRQELVAESLAADGWVADGNYISAIQPLVWAQADTVVWLDYSFVRTFWQLTKRTFGRVISQEPMWADNRESLRTALFSRDSIFVWLFHSYPRHRREYPEKMAELHWAHINFVRLRSPKETAAWLESIGQTAASRTLLT